MSENSSVPEWPDDSPHGIRIRKFLGTNGQMEHRADVAGVLGASLEIVD